MFGDVDETCLFYEDRRNVNSELRRGFCIELISSDYIYIYIHIYIWYMHIHIAYFAFASRILLTRCVLHAMQLSLSIFTSYHDCVIQWDMRGRVHVPKERSTHNTPIQVQIARLMDLIDLLIDGWINAIGGWVDSLMEGYIGRRMDSSNYSYNILDLSTHMNR